MDDPWRPWIESPLSDSARAGVLVWAAVLAALAVLLVVVSLWLGRHRWREQKATTARLLAEGRAWLDDQ